MIHSMHRSLTDAGRSISYIVKEIRGFVVSEACAGYNSVFRVWDNGRKKFWRPQLDLQGDLLYERGKWKVGQPVLIKSVDRLQNVTKFPHATEDLFGSVSAEVTPGYLDIRKFR